MAKVKVRLGLGFIFYI